MPEVACAACGMPFESEGALEMGASKLERGGRTFWFCCPPCEAEFRAGPGKSDP
jgi:YHS domain-containing protein